MASIIKTEDLTKVYNGRVKALDKLNIEIEKGEIYGLLGPNGAGKTTTINLLVTRIYPTSGTAIVNGFDIRKNSLDIRRTIGVVPQDLTTDEDLTGIENLKLVSRFYDVPQAEAEERINRLISMVNLDDAKDRLVRQYSGGMRKRLELIAGLVNDPEILFLDEPTLGLDVTTRNHMWQYVKEIQEKLDVTIILTSHYLEEVDALSDRISIIDHGKVMATGTSEELKSNLRGDVIQVTVKSENDVEKVMAFPESVDSKLTEPNTVRLKVSNSDEELPKLISYINANSIQITKLSVQKPSLDDVFLEITGKDIRKEDPADYRQVMFNMRRLRR
ncbi:MAG: ATP-binding cassette domain-containing protein [Candidatus Thermoplasmatota archaeon]|nr:ATP-binding cassette domain-containing protein [Candidatus Thermoplasmatota archaeon]MCL5731555.1 ATP-binding cassette domain-containing protein [Candidatus Thermoplasmatota archaeon]